MPFSNTFSPAPQPVLGQGSSTGNREDLRNVLVTLAPEDTPVLSMASKGRAKSTFVETVVDQLDGPNTDGIAEGADVTAFVDKFAGRARLGNYVQKFRRPFQVSDMQEAVDSVGPAKIAQAEAKAIREIKRDMEAALISDNDRSVEDGAGATYKLRGLGNWLRSNGPSDVPAGYRTPAGSIHDSGDFTEEVLLDLISSVFSVTGDVNKRTIVADIALRRRISNFSRFGVDVLNGTNPGVRNVNFDGSSGALKSAINLYESDHGIMSIVNMNPDCSPDAVNRARGYIIDPTKYSVEDLIPLGSTRLENQGGGARGFVDATLTLCMHHPQAHGKITAIV